MRLGGLHGSSSGGRLLGVLALVLAQSGQTALGATLEDGLAVLVHLQLDNHALLSGKNGNDVGRLFCTDVGARFGH